MGVDIQHQAIFLADLGESGQQVVLEACGAFLGRIQHTSCPRFSRDWVLKNITEGLKKNEQNLFFYYYYCKFDKYNLNVILYVL